MIDYILESCNHDTDRPGFQWLGNNTVHTTYDMLLYGLDDVEYKLPLSPGSPVRVGPHRFRVLREEPETATVLLAKVGLAWQHWLQYQYECAGNRIVAKLFWNRMAMRVRLSLEDNPLRRVCGCLGHVLLRLAGE